MPPSSQRPWPICVSYDSLLLATRAHTLRDGGHNVRCVSSLNSALRECSAGKDDLLLLGNRIPKAEKLKIIDCFRAFNPSGRVAAFVRAGEHRLTQVDCYIYPGDPDELTRAIHHLFAPASKPRLKRRAARKGQK